MVLEFIACIEFIVLFSFITTLYIAQSNRPNGTMRRVPTRLRGRSEFETHRQKKCSNNLNFVTKTELRTGCFGYHLKNCRT